MTLVYTNPIDGSHQFRIPSIDNETIALRVTDEGIVIDVENTNGEVIRTAYQFWSDLADLTHRNLCNCMQCTKQRWDNYHLIKAQNQTKDQT